ncbi:SprT family protein [Proteinivorax hydrogeniformans]|uniref:SprT family protein n=1 Tax=Proteinivorax hydrogeniformans TaxID=1826727 RepID=A0AAU8HQ08_9FIRM
MEKQAREITDSELTELTKTVSKQFFETLPSITTTFNHKCLINNRLQTTAGRFITPSCNIEINPKYYAKYGKNSLVDVIKHELVHYHLYRLGGGFKHGDSDFKKLCQIVGAPRYCKPLKKPKFTYICKKCSNQFLRMRKVDVKRYRCGSCKGKLLPYDKI